MGLRFDYGYRFEKLWSVHPFGNKKLAYDLWLKQKFTEAEDDELIAYLIKRRKEDVNWVAGKIHHLRTVLSQRKWEENYQRVKPSHASHIAFEDQRPIWVQRGYSNESAYRESVQRSFEEAKAKRMGLH